MRPARSSDGFALLITVTLLAFLVLLLVSLASLTRVETQVASNTLQLVQARQNATMALSLALGQLQRLAGPDQRATATADVNESGKDGTRAWTGVWGNEKPSDDYTGSARLLGWLVSGNENIPFTAETSAADFGRITAASTPVFSPSDTVTLGSASTVGALAPNVQIQGKNARLLVDPGTVADDREEDYVVAPLVDVEVPANTIPGLSGTTATTVGRYAWWVGDEGVKARLNLVDPRVDTATNPQDRFSRLLIAQRHGIELMRKDSENPSSIFGDTLYNVENPGAAGAQFRAGLGRSLNYAQAALLDGFDDAGVRSALLRRAPDLTVWSRGVLADQLRGGLRHDLTALFETNPSAWTGALKDSLDHASAFDLDGKRRIADFQDTRLYGSTSPYSMSPGTGPDTRAPLAASWEQVRSFYDHAKTNTGVVDVTPRTDTQMAIAPIVQRFGVAFDVSCAPDGSNGQLHFFPHVVLWNPYNVALRGGYRVRFEFPGDGNDTTAKFLYFITHELVDDGDGNLIPKSDDYPIYHRERIIPPPATSGSGKRSNYTMQFSIPEVEIPPGQAWVFSVDPSRAGPYQRDGDNWLANTYDTLASFTRPVSHLFTPEQIADTALALGNRAGGAGGTLPFHLLDASGNPLQLIDGPGLNGVTVEPVNNGNATRVKTTSSFQRARLNEFRDISIGPASATNQVGIFAVNSHQQINGRFNWLANYNQRADSVGRAWFEWSQGFGSVPNWGSGSANTGDSSVWGVPLISSSPARTYTGPSRLTDGAAQAILFHLPRADAPLLTLGQLQHATLLFGLNGQDPTYPFGNAYADPRIRQDRLLNPNTATSGTGPNEAHLPDVSYLLNRTLWDRFFLSGRPGVSEEQLQARIDAGEPLPDARLRWLGGTAAADAANFDRAASRLLSEGAFNVNSTSVEAWTALLAGLRGVRVNPADGNTASMTGTPYVRTPYAPGGAATASLVDRWAGYRTLTDPQVRDLAKAMVAEVQARGPFLSLADFVNRRLVAFPDETGLSGALQSVIDSVPGINGTVLDTNIPDSGDANPANAGDEEIWSVGSSNTNDYYLQSLKAPRRAATDDQRAKAAMAPGFLSQADVLQALGPGLAARSDTFVIRAYGEAVNPVLDPTDANYVTGRAWCEAVVQRFPEYVDAGNSAEVQPVTDAVVNLTAENQSFGRRFEVVSFRWLSPDDI